jgi:hypothetical protein
VSGAHFHLLTDDELHRVARDSTEPLVLELLRRMNRNADTVRELEQELDLQIIPLTECPACGVDLP